MLSRFGHLRFDCQWPLHLGPRGGLWDVSLHHFLAAARCQIDWNSLTNGRLTFWVDPLRRSCRDCRKSCCPSAASPRFLGRGGDGDRFVGRHKRAATRVTPLFHDFHICRGFWLYGRVILLLCITQRSGRRRPLYPCLISADSCLACCGRTS